MVFHKRTWIAAISTAVLLSGMPFCAAQPMDGIAPAGLRGPSLAGPDPRGPSLDSVPGKSSGLLCLYPPGGGSKLALFTAADARRMRVRTALFTGADARRMRVRTALFTEADARRMVLRSAASTDESRNGSVIEGYRPQYVRAHR